MRRQAAAAVAGATFVSLAGAVPFWPREKLATALFDDAFYYLTIARHLAAGHGPTFDGVHRTSGFQPLWQGLLVPLVAIVPGDLLPLRVVLLAQAALVALAAALLFRLLARELGEWPGALAALLLAAPPAAAAILRSGMESALLLLLLVLAAGRSAALDAGSRARSFLALGALLALAFLARLEAIVLVPVALVLLRSVAPRRLLLILAPPLATFGVYLALNRIYFGGWLPVSGMVKLGALGVAAGDRLGRLLDIPWAGQNLLVRLLGKAALEELALPLRLATFALTGSVLLLVLRRLRGRGAAFALLGSLGIVLLDKLALIFLQPWYQAPILLAAAVGAGLLLRERPGLARILALAAAAVLLARPAWDLAGRRHPERGYAEARVEAAAWLARHAPAGRAIGCWNAGAIAWLSGRRVINLDGLVNDEAFRHARARGESIAGYLERQGILWLADQACEREARPTRHLQRTRDAALDVDFELLALFGEPGPSCGAIAVWQWRR